jgi:hypothetical protein
MRDKPASARSMTIPERPWPIEWAHYQLYQGVYNALNSLPAVFSSKSNIDWPDATEIFTVNSALAAEIEKQVVECLNKLRNLWDDGSYSGCRFVRQPQTFPDVVLRDPRDKPLMGIELAGWYLLSKESEPSFRFQVTEAACAPQDMICIVPWMLDKVLCGKPIIFQPYIEVAKYAARWRTHHWAISHLENSEIVVPEEAKPYPDKALRILEKAVADTAGNFGRLARTGLMDKFIKRSMDMDICGIPVDHWLAFFKLHTEGGAFEALSARIGKRVHKKLEEAVRREETNGS